MPQYIAFLRAVNVPRRAVRMADLREALGDSGFEDVETYIQTGNVRVTSRMRRPARVEAAIEKVVAERFGIHSDTMVRTPAELTVAAAAAQRLEPLPGEVRRYLTFLKEAPPPESIAAVDAWREPGQRARIIGREIHWQLAKPFHQARLSVPGMTSLLPMPGTMRDLTVVRTLAERWGD